MSAIVVILLAVIAWIAFMLWIYKDDNDDFGGWM